MHVNRPLQRRYNAENTSCGVLAKSANAMKFAPSKRMVELFGFPIPKFDPIPVTSADPLDNARLYSAMATATHAENLEEIRGYLTCQGKG